MPYSIRYNSKKKCYSVRNKKTKRVFSKCTSLKKAKKQSRLLRAIMYNPGFVPTGRGVGLGRTNRTVRKR